MDPLAESLGRSPELFPQGMGPGGLTVIRLSEAEYRGASFLDARILSPRTMSRTIPWPVAKQAAQALPETCGFIFHIGHGGSTLLSRLLGAHPGVLPLREPELLRRLAQSEETYARRGDLLFRLWSRVFAPDQRAVIKATSFVSEIAARIMARVSQPRAILLTTKAETYLASILGGPNSRQEARMLAPMRLARLQKRAGDLPPAESEGEIIAMGWACEMTALKAAQSERALQLDSDAFFAEPAAALRACFDHFSVDVMDKEIAAIVSGPDMRRYSKAPEHAYDVTSRNEALNAAGAEHGEEIRRGLRWLERAGF